MSAHDYAWHLGQIGEWTESPEGRRFVYAEAGRDEAREAEEQHAKRCGHRDDRYRLQRDLWDLLPKSMRSCHRVRHRRGGLELVVNVDGAASMRGVVSCNRRSGCWHCGPRLLARDAELVEALVREHGYDRTVMLTLTARHWRSASLRTLRRGLANAFRRMRRHRRWRECEALRGVLDVRALEVTLGEHGWHPHLHVVLMLQGVLEDAARAELELELAELWQGSVERELGRAYRPTLEHGATLTQCNRADYLAKLGLEVTDAAHAKRARNVKGRSFWQLSTEWVANGKHADDADAQRIREYFEHMHGAKIVTWSPGLKKRAEALAPEKVVEIRERAEVWAEEWDCIRDKRTADGRDARSALLTVAELADPGDVQRSVDRFVGSLLSGRPPPSG